LSTNLKKSISYCYLDIFNQFFPENFHVTKFYKKRMLNNEETTCYLSWFAMLVWCTQRRQDSRPQSIMGIESLIPRVASLTVDCRGVNISLTIKPIWKLSNGKNFRLRYFVKTACYCCVVAIIIMTCVLLYQVYLFFKLHGTCCILAL
jgi:hypothetical protein